MNNKNNQSGTNIVSIPSALEPGQLDPVLEAEANKLVGYAMMDVHTALLAVKKAKTPLADRESVVLTDAEKTVARQAIFQSKYQYLVKKETSVDTNKLGEMYIDADGNAQYIKSDDPVETDEEKAV